MTGSPASGRGCLKVEGLKEAEAVDLRPLLLLLLFIMPSVESWKPALADLEGTSYRHSQSLCFSCHICLVECPPFLARTKGSLLTHSVVFLLLLPEKLSVSSGPT